MTYKLSGFPNCLAPRWVLSSLIRGTLVLCANEHYSLIAAQRGSPLFWFFNQAGGVDISPEKKGYDRYSVQQVRAACWTLSFARAAGRPGGAFR